MTRRFCAPLAALMLWTTGAAAQEHLVPETSILGGDEHVLDHRLREHELFAEAYGREVRALMIEEPSFSSERALFLAEDAGAWRIAMLTLAVPSSAPEYVRGFSKEDLADPEKAAFAAKVPKDYRDIAVARCDVAIDAGLGARLQGVWKAMLLDTRFVREGEGGAFVTDGTIYHFSTYGDVFQTLAGRTQSPMPGTRPAALVEIADTMAQYCESKTPALLSALDARVAALRRTVAP